jgi:putative phosphoesterase
LIVHAGDFVALPVLRQLQQLGEVIAVHGNVDDQEVRFALPARTEFEVLGFRIGIVHDPGSARARAARLRRWFPDADAVVFGHTHAPLHERASDGLQLFNPGSPTERRRAPERTMGVAYVSAGELRFELVSLA